VAHHDHKALRAAVDAIVITRAKPSRRRLQHLCLDKGYDYPFVDDAVADTAPTSAAGKRHPARRSVEKERAVGLSSALTVGSTVPDDYSFGGKRRLRTTKLFSRSRARNSFFSKLDRVSG
jgi:hypothetical protein